MYGSRRKRQGAFQTRGVKRLTGNSDCPITGHYHPVKWCPIVKDSQARLQARSDESTAEEKISDGKSL